MADAMSDQLWTNGALSGLLPALAASGRAPEALERILAGEIGYTEARILAQIGPHLDESLLSRAISAVNELEPWDRGSALAGLAPRLADLGRPVEALELITSIPAATRGWPRCGLRHRLLGDSPSPSSRQPGYERARPWPNATERTWQRSRGTCPGHSCTRGLRSRTGNRGGSRRGRQLDSVNDNQDWQLATSRYEVTHPPECSSYPAPASCRLRVAPCRRLRVLSPPQPGRVGAHGIVRPRWRMSNPRLIPLATERAERVRSIGRRAR